LRKKDGNRCAQNWAELDQVKEVYLNNNVIHPAPGCVTIVRASEIAFYIGKISLVLKVAIQHSPELLFMNI
jgi:hypothetical protein